MQNTNNLFPDLQEQPKPIKEPHGTYLEGKLIASKAWLSLQNVTAVQVYCILTSQIVKLKANGKKARKGRKQEYVCPNERNLKFTYKQAKDIYGIGQTRFTRAIDDLIKHGLLDIVKPGNAATRELTVYGLSRRWVNYGPDNFQSASREKAKRGFCRTRSTVNMAKLSKVHAFVHVKIPQNAPNGMR